MTTTDTDTEREKPPVHCRICGEPFWGDADAGISPGDQLADHLTDEHQHVLSKHLRAGVRGHV